MGLEKVKGHLDALATGLKYLVSGHRLTIMYPEEVEALPEGYRGMIIYHWDKCIKCGLCAMICPADAMKMYVVEEETTDPKKPVRRPGINYTRCIFCGFCVDICPVFALEFSDVHDTVFDTFEEQIFPPKKFAEGVPRPEFDKEPRKVRAIPDERRGLIYEPVD